MKRSILFICSVLLWYSCSDDDKAIDIVTEEIEYGAVVRTLQFNNAEFNVGDPDSVFSVDIEVQDELDGDLLEAVDLMVSFVDNTPAGGDFSTTEASLGSLLPEDFGLGANGFPKINLNYSQAAMAAAVGVSLENISCSDQFLLRTVIRLTDGRSFTTGTASSIILAYETFFSSPYCYTINVVEPIDEELFTGDYVMTSIVDGPLGPTFNESGTLVSVEKAPHSNTVRQVRLKHILSHPSNEQPRIYEFSIVCDQVVFRKNQLSSVIGQCTFSTSSPILLGPGEENAPANILDDSVFEVWFVEGYLGFDGRCGFGTVPSRIRFTKQ